MKRLFGTIALFAALAACDNTQPAGGQGFFDPPPAAPILPESLATQPIGPGTNVPRSVLATNPNPSADLAADVRGALAATAPAPGDAGTFGDGGVGAVAATNPDGTLVMPGNEEIGIDPNDQSINLALTSQEEQARQRDAAQLRRDAAREQLVVVEPEPVPQQNTNANVVRFARDTTHPVGVRVYNRPAFRDRLQSRRVCGRFSSDDEAQRQFLANGGPATDRFNLDPDGDGFACNFDPEKYRQLNF